MAALRYEYSELWEFGGLVATCIGKDLCGTLLLVARRSSLGVVSSAWVGSSRRRRVDGKSGRGEVERMGGDSGRTLYHHCSFLAAASMHH